MKMNNNSKFVVKKTTIITKYLFHTSNILLIIFYLFPGSILGCILFNDCLIQPQLTSDFIVSSNHVFMFLIVSLLGLVSCLNNKRALNKIIVYLFSLAVFIELIHIIIPNRGFEVEDLGGNIVGVVISLIIFLIFKFWKKNEQF